MNQNERSIPLQTRMVSFSHGPVLCTHVGWFGRKCRKQAWAYAGEGPDLCKRHAHR